MAQLKGDDKQEYVAELFARISRRYDLMNTLMTGGMHHLWKRRTAQITAQGLQGNSLDVATGTGDLALALSHRPEITYSVGIDLLTEMLVLAQNKVKNNSTRPSFVAGDALSLPFPDNTFACATAGFSLRNMPDLPQAIAEMVRVVQPGGRVTTLELTPMTAGLRAKLFRIYFHRLVPLMGQLVAGERSAYTYLPQSVDYFLEANNLAQLFRQCGLVDVNYVKLGMGTVAIHYGTKPSDS